jgi:hypothetical protein
MEISHDFPPKDVMEYKSKAQSPGPSARRGRRRAGGMPRQGEAVPAVPYFVTCRNCGLLLYSAAPITERVCQRCGAELPEPEQGAPPNDPPRDAEDEDAALDPRRQARA